MTTTNRVTATIANVFAMTGAVRLYDMRGDLSLEDRVEITTQPERSRLRCRDIMTRDLAVATRDTTLSEVARMMKQEDTGVIPVVEYDAQAGNGRSEGPKENMKAAITRAAN